MERKLFLLCNLKATLSYKKTFSFLKRLGRYCYQTNCLLTSRCDSVILIAPDTVCLGQEFKLVVRKNAKCKKQIDVFESGLNAIFVRLDNDSVFVMRAEKPANYNFGARFKGCTSQVLAQKEVRLSNVVNTPIKLLINDTVLCPGKQFIATAPSGYYTYSWNKGQAINTNSYTINAPGQYVLEALSYCGTISRDTLNIGYDSSMLGTSPREISICIGDTATFQLITNSPLNKFFWFPAKAATIDVGNALFKTWPVTSARYRIEAFSAFNCNIYDSVMVRVLETPNLLSIVESNYELCKKDSLIIVATLPFAKYLWSNGDSGRVAILRNSGNYKLTVFDNNGCTNTADFSVREMECNDSLYFPSAFTPNGDGLNDQFKALTMGRIPVYFELKVNNRWGQLVFKITNPKTAWNGTFNSEMQPAGNYVWHCQYEFTGQKKKLIKGNFVLIRQ